MPSYDTNTKYETFLTVHTKKIPALFSHLFMISLHYSVTNIFGILMTLLCAQEPE